jgi:hypothetical protein
MREALEHLEARRTELSGHPLLRQFEANPPLEQVAPFVPLMSFFVLAFQDLMRMTGERASDPRLRDLLRRHCEEEVGHERWFFADLVRLGGAPPDLAALFGPAHAPTREATYALAAEVLGARDDVERLCLIFALEAASDVGFAAFKSYFTNAGVVGDLVYFAGIHREIEEAHSLFDDKINAIVLGIVLDPEGRARARGAIDRIFAAVRLMVDGLATAIARGPAGRVLR